MTGWEVLGWLAAGGLVWLAGSASLGVLLGASIRLADRRTVRSEPSSRDTLGTRPREVLPPEG